jgi:hypothetical protein
MDAAVPHSPNMSSWRGDQLGGSADFLYIIQSPTILPS